MSPILLSQSSNTSTLISALIDKARDLGFVAVGFCRPRRPLFLDRFYSWISAGKHGEMAWLEKSRELREKPASLLHGCNTIVSLAYPYSPKKPRTPDGYAVARYVEPKKTDYHDRLRKLAKSLARPILEWFPESKTRVCVDSAPILERSFAYVSGIGFIGKNNMLIVPGYGSYVFLVEILTTASLSFAKKAPMQNQCGSCSLCLDTCPTGALEGAFSMDASRCLSYLTIEYAGVLSNDIGRKMGDCFFGCDRCQEACPFNGEEASQDLALPSTEEILGMDKGDFAHTFGKTALHRGGLEKLKANIRAMQG